MAISRQFFKTIAYGMIILAYFALVACSGGQVKDPAKVLTDSTQSPSRHRTALAMLQVQGNELLTRQVLKHMLVANNFAPESREMAYEELLELDPEALQGILEIRLPRSDRLMWRAWVCGRIADQQWLEMTPTLIRAWARPMPGWVDEPEDRPERLALVEMYGEDQLPAVLLQVLMDSNPITASNLRARCWELLIQEGKKEELIALLNSSDIDSNDGMLTDLRDLSRDTGVIPRNREEILWARYLFMPEHREYYQGILEAIGSVSEDRRNALELRDLAVIHAAANHDPSLLTQTDDELYTRLQEFVKSQKRTIPSADFKGWPGKYTESLHEVRGEIGWGDLAAMLLAVQAMGVEEVRSHVFRYAEEDRSDKDTEYGGVIALDEKGRFELLEFEPRMKTGDNKFQATQAMFEKGYTSLFHFHFHAQSYDNSQYAGPHIGDMTYARNTRANCLVFTFLNSKTMNVDFYRHGRVVVDLGQIRRPG